MTSDQHVAALEFIAAAKHASGGALDGEPIDEPQAIEGFPDDGAVRLCGLDFLFDYADPEGKSEYTLLRELSVSTTVYETGYVYFIVAPDQFAAFLERLEAFRVAAVIMVRDARSAVNPGDSRKA